MKKAEEASTPEAVVLTAMESRSQAIARYMRDGYRLKDGTRRHVHSAAHAEFVAAAGLIELP